MRTFPVFIAGITACLLSAGCSTVGQSQMSLNTSTGKPYSISKQTAMQKAVGKCIATVGFGAVVGGIIGAATRNNAGGGALAGAALGAGVCVVFVQIAAEEDQARIREMELEAVRANANQQRTLKTKAGKVASVRTTITPAPAPKRASSNKSSSATPNFTACRYATQSVEVEGTSAAADKQLWCRIDTGDWQPISQ